MNQGRGGPAANNRVSAERIVSSALIKRGAPAGNIRVSAYEIVNVALIKH